MSAQHSHQLIEQKFTKPQLQVYSFVSVLRVQHVESNCAGRGQPSSSSCGMKSVARASSTDGPAPADISDGRPLSQGLQSSHSWQWLIQKKIIQTISWDPAIWSCVLAKNMDALLNGGSNFCSVLGTVTFRCMQTTNKQ